MSRLSSRRCGATRVVDVKFEVPVGFQEGDDFLNIFEGAAEIQAQVIARRLLD